MKRDEYYENLHEKNIKAFMEVVRKVKRGLYLITHCSIEKLAVGDGYRFIVYLKEK